MHRLQPGPTPYSAVPGPAVLACLLLVFAAATRAGGASAPGFRFVAAGEASGFQPYQMAAGKGGGAAAADYDADGDVDLFVPTAAGTPNHLYQNNGDGTFLEIAAEVGLDAMTGRRAALWFDYNGDNRLDLFVAGDCWNAGPDCSLASTIALYRQTETGAFEDVTGAAGLGGDLVFGTTAHRGGAAAGDFNNDGWLDLIVGLWMGEARLWRNNGDGTFTDVSLVSGIGGTGDAISHWQPVLYDFDRNGLLDVYYAVDFTANRFLMRQPNGMFIDGAVEAGLNNAWNDMGIALGDYDNDWDMDVYVTNIYTGARRNELYRNDSTKPAMAFERQASATGSGEGGWGWGCTFLDADNDGWVDLAATNGWFDGQGTNDPSRFFLNSGGPSPVFTDVGPAVGFDDTLWGSALVSADLDRDGDLDLVQTCNGTGSSSNPHALRLYRNDPVVKSNGNNWLVIKPRMKGPNRRAIGAEVRIEAGGVKQTRAITAGISHLGQEPAEANSSPNRSTARRGGTVRNGHRGRTPTMTARSAGLCRGKSGGGK